MSEGPKEIPANCEHIALVGCGFAGTSAFFQLVDRFPIKKISIFETSGNFGKPLLYSYWMLKVSVVIEKNMKRLCCVTSLFVRFR